jgi:hypothetical protein
MITHGDRQRENRLDLLVSFDVVNIKSHEKCGREEKKYQNEGESFNHKHFQQRASRMISHAKVSLPSRWNDLKVEGFV